MIRTGRRPVGDHTTRWAPVRRCAAAVLAVAVATGAVLVATPGPARAAACAGTGSGVTVVVDFSAFGGGVQVRCAPGDPGSGIGALEAAGFAVTGTQRWGRSFVCRLDGVPNQAKDPCVNTPPIQAYWAYWHASRGGSWTYSSQGALAYDPKPGSVEGWAFGAGPRPGIAPPAAPAPPRPPAAPRTTRPAAPPGAPVQPAATSPVPAPAPVASSAGTSLPPSDVPPSDPPPQSSRPDEAGPLAREPTAGRGAPTGALLGIGLVLLLAGLAGWTVHRRRRAS